MGDLTARSERRHELCRFGTFARKAYHIDPRSGAETPVALPTCAFTSDKIPPRAVFALGAALDSDECERCNVYTPLVARSTHEGGEP